MSLTTQRFCEGVVRVLATVAILGYLSLVLLQCLGCRINSGIPVLLCVLGALFVASFIARRWGAERIGKRGLVIAIAVALLALLTLFVQL